MSVARSCAMLPAMERWEYLIVYWADNLASARATDGRIWQDGDEPPAVERVLNELGAEGWELVSLSSTAVLKRPIED